MTATLPELRARLHKIEDDIAACELTIDNLTNRISECGFAISYLSSEFEHEYPNLDESEKKDYVIKTSAEIQRLMKCQEAHELDKASAEKELALLCGQYNATDEARRNLDRPTFFSDNRTTNQPGQTPSP